MMTSAVRIGNKAAFASRGSGMTLLEVVIAMSLIVILMGLGMVKYAAGSDERELREAVSRIEAMSSRGHAMSILHQKPFWVRIEEGQVVLAGADVRASARSLDAEAYQPDLAWDDEEEENANREVIYDTFPTNVLVGLRRWGAKEDAWTYPGEKVVVTWSFQSSGLCEPVAFRLDLGESWVVMHMHPLTARIEQEEMEIR
ncbi:MAG: type II secretion system protein [Verrucomicrobia bacterium]|nr:type II secretion system protein [Verrucomicrobiota bacterium]